VTVAETILSELREHGVELERRGERLRVRAKVAPPQDLLQRLRTYKTELIRLVPDPTERSHVNFRLSTDAGWATAVGKPGESSAELAADLRQRWPEVEIDNTRNPQ